MADADDLEFPSSLDELSAQTDPAPSGSRWMKPPKAGQVKAELTDAEKINLIMHLDDREAKIGYALAVLAVVIGLLANVLLVPGHLSEAVVPIKVTPTAQGTCPTGSTLVKQSAETTATTSTHSASSTTKGELPKGDICVELRTRGEYLVQLGISLLVAFGLWITARTRRRSRVILVTFMCALVFLASSTIFMLIYAVYGVYLLMRSSRLQRETGGRKAQAARLAEERQRKTAARRGGAKVATTTPAGNPAPKANKRYTPKAPPKKRPPTRG